MKIIATTGSLFSGYNLVHELMVLNGLFSNEHGVGDSTESVALLHNKIYDLYDLPKESEGRLDISPNLGQICNEFARTLFLGNIDSPIWGWSDEKTMSLANFWKNYDPQIRFVLVYSSPEFAVAQLLKNGNESSGGLRELLSGWMAYNKSLLDFYESNQERCLLISSDALQLSGRAVIKVLSEWVGVPVSIDNVGELGSDMLPSLASGHLIKSLFDEVLMSSLLDEKEKANNNTSVEVESRLDSLIFDELVGEKSMSVATYKEAQEPMVELLRKVYDFYDVLQRSVGVAMSGEQRRGEGYISALHELHELKSRSDALNSSNSVLREKVGKLEVKAHRLGKRESSLVEELGHKSEFYNQQMSAIQKKLESAEGEAKSLISLRGELQKKQNETRDLKKQNNQIKSELAQENDLLMVQLTQIQEVLFEKVTELERLESVSLELKEQQDKLALFNKNEVAISSEATERNRKLEAQLSRLKSELSNKSDDIQKLKFLQADLREQKRKSRLLRKEKTLVESELMEKNQLLSNQVIQAHEKLKNESKKIRNLQKIKNDLQSSKENEELSRKRIIEDSSQENELLLLQLHHVQEELEQYYFKYEKVASGYVDGVSLTGCKVDFTSESFVGENWYYAEVDGRWSGPHTKSTVSLPALTEGEYELRLELVGAMNTSILSGLEVFVNGRKVELKYPDMRVPWRIRRRSTSKFPMILSASFSTHEFDSSIEDKWSLMLITPEVLSPADMGGDVRDLRCLGVRVRSVQIVSTY